MKVHCDEGVAIHVAPDPCAGAREDVGEASVGDRIGQPLSRETVINPSADVVYLTEGKIGRRDTASARRARRGLRPWHVRTLLGWEPGDLWIGHRPSGLMGSLCLDRSLREQRDFSAHDLVAGGLRWATWRRFDPSSLPPPSSTVNRLFYINKST